MGQRAFWKVWSVPHPLYNDYTNPGALIEHMSNSEQFFAEHDYNTLCEIVEQTGIRGCLGYAVGRPNSHVNGLDPIPKDGDIRQCLNAYSRWNGQANGRIRVWFGITMPGLYVSAPVHQFIPPLAPAH